MSDPFLSEIRIVGFNFAPRGWATCDGQILPINQNQALFSLLGTMYGGDGRTSFALPDMRGRAPVSQDTGANIGTAFGQQYTAQQIPTIRSISIDRGLDTSNTQTNVMQNVGTNITPYIGVNYAIALQGIFPNRN